MLFRSLEAESHAAREAEAAKAAEEGILEADRPLPASPITNLDVITELRALREQVTILQAKLDGESGR